MQGIGDNAQGFVNSILFCVFTKKVRQGLLLKDTYVNLIKCNCYKCCYMRGSALDETTRFTHDRQFYEDTTLSYGSHVRTQSAEGSSIQVEST